MLAADLLREALDGLTSAAVVRTVSAMTARLFRPDDPPEFVAQCALDDGLAALRVARGALAVTTLRSGPVLAAGDADLLAAPDVASSPDRLIVTRRDDDTGDRLLVAAAREGRRFTGCRGGSRRSEISCVRGTLPAR